MSKVNNSTTRDGLRTNRSAVARLHPRAHALPARSKRQVIGLREGPPDRESAAEVKHVDLASIRQGAERNVFSRLAKRSVEVLVSCVVLLLTLPLMAYIAVYIRIHSGGAVLFRQVRIKRNRRRPVYPLYYQDPRSKAFRVDRRVNHNGHMPVGADRRQRQTVRYFRCPRSGTMAVDRRQEDLGGEPFVFYKFRTMYADARQRYPELYRYTYSEEEVEQLRFKDPEDPRVPRWAQWLRKSSLDELPNFINVLRGDMSLVGPRPDIPEMIRYYSSKQRAKLLVKPGVTGLAQIKGRGNLHFQDTLVYDLLYVRSRSFLFDLRILAKTVLVTIFRDGAH